LKSEKEKKEFVYFLTAACCLKRDFCTHPPHPPKNGNRLLYFILKIARLLYCVLKKARQKVGQKKSAKKSAKNSGKKGSTNAARKVGKKFLNLSCCCLETGFVKELLLKMATPQHNIWQPCNT